MKQMKTIMNKRILGMLLLAATIAAIGCKKRNNNDLCNSCSGYHGTNNGPIDSNMVNATIVANNETLIGTSHHKIGSKTKFYFNWLTNDPILIGIYIYDAKNTQKSGLLYEGTFTPIGKSCNQEIITDYGCMANGGEILIQFTFTPQTTNPKHVGVQYDVYFHH